LLANEVPEPQFGGQFSAVVQPAAEPEPDPQPEPAPEPEAEPEPASEPTYSAPEGESAVIAPAAEPESPQPVERPEQTRPASYDDTVPQFTYSRSSFEHEPPFKPRRNMVRIATYAATFFAVIVCAAIIVLQLYGLPNWVPFANQTFAAGKADLQLDFPPNRLDRRTLPNGKEFFGASGKVTNIGKERRTVPPILIVLRDANKHTVYSWEVIAPKHELNPGESVTVNEAVLDVPRSATEALVGWKPD
jgi:hypothetical protein